VLIQYRILALGMGTPQPVPPVPSGGGGSSEDRERPRDPRYLGLRKVWPESILVDSFVNQPVVVMLDPEAEPTTGLFDRPRPKQRPRRLALVPEIPTQRITGPSIEHRLDALGTARARLGVAPAMILDSSIVAPVRLSMRAAPPTIVPVDFELGHAHVMAKQPTLRQRLAQLVQDEPLERITRVERVALVERLERIGKPPDRTRR